MLKEDFVILKVSKIARYNDYFINKGYLLPKKIDNRGVERLDLSEEIKIRIHDLPPNSNIKVNRICDNCGEEKEIFYFSYLKQKEKNENDLCKICSIRERYKAKDGESLSDLNEKISEEFLYSVEEGYEEYTSKDFRITSNIVVMWKCSECNHEWKARISDRTANDSGCPACWGRVASDKNRLTLLFPEIANEFNSTLNKDRILHDLTYASHYEVWWKCKNCSNEWKTPVHSRTIMKSGCPVCAESKGEKRIRAYLEDCNIQFIAQKEYNGLIGLGGNLLSYDFYLPSLNLLIEYQGHFHDGKMNDYVAENLERQQEHDRRKREYAKNNSINLLEIWYWDFDNIEEILNNTLLKGVV